MRVEFAHRLEVIHRVRRQRRRFRRFNCGRRGLRSGSTTRREQADCTSQHQPGEQSHDGPRYITKLKWNISQQKCCINSFTDSECSATPPEAWPMPQTGRRNALKLLSGSFALASFPWAQAADSASNDSTAADGTLALLFDGALKTRVLFRGKPLTPFQASESLLLKDGALDEFVFAGHTQDAFKDARHGAGSRHVITGKST